MNVQINVKDLPEHGLKLIAPTDSSFQGKLSLLPVSKANHFLTEALRPYSVLIENNGRKLVAGYRVVWEVIKQDGTISVKQGGGVNEGLLISKVQQGPGAGELTGEFTLKPDSFAFISFAGSLTQNGGSITGYSGSANPAVIEQFRRSLADKDSSSIEDLVNADLRNCTMITASIDGVFFEDGAFVGPDATGFFMTVEAGLNAKRDLMAEIAFAVQRKRSLDEIFSYVEEIAGSPLPTHKMNREDVYNVFKKMEAEGVLKMRATLDSQRALSICLRENQYVRPKLKRL